jgi:hypothetical protein
MLHLADLMERDKHIFATIDAWDNGKKTRATSERSHPILDTMVD